MTTDRNRPALMLFVLKSAALSMRCGVLRPCLR
jgi:hypothetical protein